MGARPVVCRHPGRQRFRPLLVLSLFVASAPLFLRVPNVAAGSSKPPAARLSVTQPPIPPRTVRADASASNGRGSNIVSFTFDFGDGSTKVVQQPPNSVATHSYAVAGTYNVRVTVLNGANLTATASVSMVVVPENPPAARLSVTQLASPFFTVSANGSTSTDGDLTPISTYSFDFGDGTPTVTASSSSQQHTYAGQGSYTVTLICTDTGGIASNPASMVMNVAPPPENPPVARLVLTQTGTYSVKADGSTSTDTDLTTIASYSFNFGDGTAAVVTNPPTSTATHTYAAGGTYTVTLIATDSGGNASSPVSQAIAVGPAPDNPPIARLSVFQTGTFSVSADGSSSTDTDTTPIASYRFSFGDGTSAVITNPPTSSATHTYGAAGTYTVSLVATDTGGNASAATNQSVTVGSSPGGVAVYAGYYDTHHTDNLKTKPNPWRGASNVVFVGTTDAGTTNGWDTSALRIDNQTGAPLTGVNATVDMGTYHFALWNAQTIPAGYSLILAQTALENFDGSDTSPAGCYSCNPNDCLTKVSSAIPVVHLTIGASTTNYYDPNQILNTKGADAAGCPYTGTRNDESQPWQRLSTTAPSLAGANGTSRPALEVPPQSEMWMAPPFPNPAGRAVTVRFGLPVAGETRLGVYDVTGRLVRSSISSHLGAGDYVDVVDVSGLRPGAYFCTLWTPGRTLHQAFIISR